MKTSKKEFNKKLIFLVCSVVYFGLVLILTSFICNAASDQDYFPMIQNKNNKFTETDISNIESTFDSVNNFIIARYHHTNSAGTKYVRVLYFPKDNSVMIYGEIFNNLHQFSVYKVGTGNVKSQDITLSGNTLTKQGSAGTNYFNDFTAVESSNYSSDYDYISNFQLYSNNNPDTRKIVLLYGSQEPVIPEDDTYPQDNDKPSLDTYYNPSEAPLFDNSSVSNGIESIYNILNWFFGANGIGGIINYLVDNTNWALQKVINNIRQVLENVSSELQEVVLDFSDTVSGFLSDIQDKISDFYDDFVEFADLFIHPFDKAEFEEQIEGCQLISQYDDLLDNCDIIREVFATAQEKDSFILYIDFENPFADSEHKLITSEINFNWLVPLRSVYRPFLWVFALLDCFIGGCQLLGNIIGGKAK